MNDLLTNLFKPFDEIERSFGECFELISRERESRLNGEAINRRKDEFLAIVAHEWGNTLNVISGWLDLIGDVKLSENVLVAQGFAAIRRGAQLQKKLVEDLLAASQKDCVWFRLDLREINPTVLLETVLGDVKCLADAKQIEIETNLISNSKGLPVDTERLEQVLRNLFSNAIKFTPQGGKIVVETNRLKSGLEIKISDSGRGIDAKFLPHIFEPFSQFSPFDDEGKRQGFGLGLAIARQIVELHGGSIKVTSEGTNRGATFTVQIPNNLTVENEVSRHFQENPQKLSFFHMSK